MVGLGTQYILVLEENRPPAWPHETAQGPDGRRLSHAVSPHESHHLSGGDVKIDTEERLGWSIPGLQVLDGKEPCHGCSTPR